MPIKAAWKTLRTGGSALDAVENGARWAESDLCNSTVGRCGPDRDGHLGLDASVMDGDGRCGSVAALEDILRNFGGASRHGKDTACDVSRRRGTAIRRRTRLSKNGNC